MSPVAILELYYENSELIVVRFKRSTMKRTKLEEVVEIADNPEPRCPCVLLLDVSRSMMGTRIDALNEGLEFFRDDLNRDSLVSRRVEVAVVTFGSNARIVRSFTTADQFHPPRLRASGLTYMGTGINLALDLIEERKQLYRDNGIDCYRPWIFMITDGKPEGETAHLLDRAKKRLRDSEAKKSVAFFAVGVGGADLAGLGAIAVRPPLALEGLEFRELFLWLSASMKEYSHSRPGDRVALPPMSWLRKASVMIEANQDFLKDAAKVTKVVFKAIAAII